MAKHLDLEEQEQLDQFKHFWRQYGNIITWVLILILAGFAGWNFYQQWQKSQSIQSAALFDEVEKALLSGDPAKFERVFTDMKEKFPYSTYAQQTGLLIAKAYYDSGKTESAKTVLLWVGDHAKDEGYKSIAWLRLSAVLIDLKSYDEALKYLSKVTLVEFLPLASDRKGDLLRAQGKNSEATVEYLAAYKGLDDRTEYRRLIEVKLAALGASPPTVVANTESKQ
jgi:predicted negative regulator of RcsB-dependent stress response